MNSLFLNFDDETDTNVVFTKLKELFPNVIKIKELTVLKELTELTCKDDEMDVKFEFKSPHTVKMTYHGDEFVSIDDDEFHIYSGDKTEEGAILDYVCDLEYFWDDYISKDLSDKKMTSGLKEKINAIKSKVKKLC